MFRWNHAWARRAAPFVLWMACVPARLAAGDAPERPTTIRLTVRGATFEGDVAAHGAAGVTLRDARGERTFRWEILGAATAYEVMEQLIPATDGAGWLAAAYRLETLRGGPAWADRALDRATAADPSLSARAAALRAERAFYGEVVPADPAPPSDDDAPPPRRTPRELGDYVLALCVDRQDRLWVGTEERGLWVEDPAAPEGERWRQFIETPSDPSVPQTLPGRNVPLPSAGDAARADDPAPAAEAVPPPPEPSPAAPPHRVIPGFPERSVTALACDRPGRVWAGLERHGVAVWNGESWKTYGPGDGPLGHRVFDIEVHPLDGDVWIATEAGLTRYRAGADAWTHYAMGGTAADDGGGGLAAHGIAALAFDPRTGDAWIGYEAHGVGRAARDGRGEYPAWEHFHAPDAFPAAGPQPEPRPGKTWPLPNTPAGAGLPSNFVNDLAVDRDGTVWVGTHTGLAWSKDGGAHWRYLRGRDWAARVNGLHEPPQPFWNCRPEDVWPESDNVRRLAVDARGALWAGYWRGEWRAFWPAGGVPVPARDPADPDRVDFATGFLPTADGLLVGSYGQGVKEVRFAAAAPPASGEPAAAPRVSPAADAESGGVRPDSASAPIPHPTPAPAPTAADLAARAALLRAVPADGRPSPVVALPDDWRTRGDWLGRYGTYWAVLGATVAPKNYVWGAGGTPVAYRHFIGPHKRPGDSVRHWVHWLYTTDPRSLEMPPTFYDSRVKKGLALPHETRRQSEWDDHSEAYPGTWDGPHLYCTLRIPEGDFVLSLYNFNKDGLSTQNRFRDYPIVIKDGPAGDDPLSRLDDWDARPEFGRGRFHQFRGGVWKRWRVQGPRALTISLRRNASWSTILAAVMLDRFDPLPDPYFDDETRRSLLSPGADHADAGDAGADTLLDAAETLLDELRALRERAPDAWAAHRKATLLAIARALPEAPTDGPERREAASRPPIRRLLALRTRVAHALRDFNAYESALRALGHATPREKERALTWDGVTASHAGLNRALLARPTIAAEPSPSVQ